MCCLQRFLGCKPKTISKYLFNMSYATSESKPAIYKVFVYGTLKSGEPNHCVIDSKENGYSKFLFRGKTKEKYPLIIGSKYNIPFLISHCGKGEQVCGEVYEVDSSMLEKLDELEGHPDYYERRPEPVVPVNNPGDSSEVVCWIYFYQQHTPEMLKLPLLRNYTSKGDHNLPYVPRDQRK